MTMSRKHPFYREPIVHFLVAGAAIFALSGMRAPDIGPDSDQIVVTVAQIERLANRWTQSWKRPPGDSELQALIRDYVREEVYFREALKLGLDADDAVIRRRLRQKMEFLATAEVELPAMDDTVMTAYMNKNLARYMIEPRYDFEQVYFRIESPTQISKAILKLSQGEANPDDLGDAINLPRRMSGADTTELVRVFGNAFASALAETEPGEWQGPVESGFGFHVVRLSSVTPARVATLNEVRQAVENDFRSELTAAAEAAVFERLAAGYKIEIEVPD